MKIKPIAACVRIEQGRPIIFFRGERGLFDCFTYEDGHNEASSKYMLSLPLAQEDYARTVLARYQAVVRSYPDCENETYRLVKRFNKGTK